MRWRHVLQKDVPTIQEYKSIFIGDYIKKKNMLKTNKVLMLIMKSKSEQRFKPNSQQVLS